MVMVFWCDWLNKYVRKLIGVIQSVKLKTISIKILTTKQLQSLPLKHLVETLTVVESFKVADGVYAEGVLGCPFLYSVDPYVWM